VAVHRREPRTAKFITISDAVNPVTSPTRPKRVGVKIGWGGNEYRPPARQLQHGPGHLRRPDLRGGARMSTATLDFESYAIVAKSNVGGRPRKGWMVSWRTGAVITQEHLGGIDLELDSALEAAKAKLPERDVFGPEDRKPWE
jgi:hypothetical protein